jgi:hypothetical protein
MPDMQNAIYLVSLVAALCGLWLLWNFGIKPLRLDMFRERLFELRFRLFRVGLSEELPFDNDAYRAIEVLICGLLRFGHRITLFTYILSSQEQARAKKEGDSVDVNQQIALRVSRLDPATQEKLNALLGEIRNAVILQMATTSLFFLSAAAILLTAKYLGIWKPDKAKISYPVEQEAYREEMRRRPLRVAIA